MFVAMVVRELCFIDMGSSSAPRNLVTLPVSHTDDLNVLVWLCSENPAKEYTPCFTEWRSYHHLIVTTPYITQKNTHLEAPRQPLPDEL